MESGMTVMIGLAVCCILLSVLGGVAYQQGWISLPDMGGLGASPAVASSPETAASPETGTDTTGSEPAQSDKDKECSKKATKACKNTRGETAKKDCKSKEKKKCKGSSSPSSSSSSKRGIASDLIGRDVVIYFGACKKHSALLSVEDSATSTSTSVSTWCRFSETAGAQSWRIDGVAGSDTDVYIRSRKTGTLLTAGGGGLPQVTVAATMTTAAEKKRQMWTIVKLSGNTGYLIRSRWAEDGRQAYKFLTSNGCTKPEWSYPSIYLWNTQVARWGIMKAPSVADAESNLKDKTNWAFCK